MDDFWLWVGAMAFMALVFIFSIEAASGDAWNRAQFCETHHINMHDCRGMK